MTQHNHDNRHEHEHYRSRVHGHIRDDDHGYNHDNDYGGENGHGHDHSHIRQFDVAWSAIEAEVHRQDEASVLSCSFSLPESQNITLDRVAATLLAIARDIDAAGGLTGHVKALVKTGGGLRVSVTDSTRDPDLPDGGATVNCAGCAIDLAAIALAIDPDQLVAIVESELEELGA